MRFKNSRTIYFIAILLAASWPVSSQATDIIYGKDIKDQASKFFNEIGIKGEILTSNKRAFLKIRISNDHISGWGSSPNY